MGGRENVVRQNFVRHSFLDKARAVGQRQPGSTFSSASNANEVDLEDSRQQHRASDASRSMHVASLINSKGIQGEAPHILESVVQRQREPVSQPTAPPSI